MGLRDRLKNASDAYKEATGFISADVASLRADLRDCVERIHTNDRDSFLGPYHSWGKDVEALPADEVCLAATPAVAEGRGFLVLTSDRLLYGGQGGRAEFYLSDLSMSHIEVDRINTLKVYADPSGGRYMEFGLSPYKDETVDQFLQALERAIRDARKPKAATSPPASSADELEKWAGLLDKGVISQEEFDAKKAKLL